MQPVLPITNGFFNVRRQSKFKTDGTELPAIDAISRPLYCTKNVQPQYSGQPRNNGASAKHRVRNKTRYDSVEGIKLTLLEGS